MAKQQPSAKRYIVTYKSADSVDVATAASILGINQGDLSDGVSLMASDETNFDAHVLHFEKAGATILHLTDSQANQLAQHDAVLAVEEDVPVSISNYPTDFTPERADPQYLAALQAQAYYQGLYARQDGSRLPDIFGPPVIPDLRWPKWPIREQPLIPDWWRWLNTQRMPYGIRMINAPDAWARGIVGTGVKVAVVDTGCGPHSDLTIHGGASFVPGVTSYADDQGHGTHVAGTIAARNNRYGVVGVSPAARLYALKALDSTGNGSSSWTIAALEWCILNGMDVVNLSLGGRSNPLVAYSTIIRKLQDANCVVVCAAGNTFGSGFPFVNAPANTIQTINFPGLPPNLAIPNASPIAVASVDSAAVVAHDSSRGGRAGIPWNQVTVSAPGVGVESTTRDGGYGFMNGTSMACPHVAGTVALLKQRFPGITPATVKTKLIGTARDLGVAGYDITYGAGLINAHAATI
jgi:subtilisin